MKTYLKPKFFSKFDIFMQIYNYHYVFKSLCKTNGQVFERRTQPFD